LLAEGERKRPRSCGKPNPVPRPGIDGKSISNDFGANQALEPAALQGRDHRSPRYDVVPPAPLRPTLAHHLLPPTVRSLERERFGWYSFKTLLPFRRLRRAPSLSSLAENRKAPVPFNFPHLLGQLLTSLSSGTKTQYWCVWPDPLARACHTLTPRSRASK